MCQGSPDYRIRVVCDPVNFRTFGQPGLLFRIDGENDGHWLVEGSVHGEGVLAVLRVGVLLSGEQTSEEDIITGSWFPIEQNRETDVKRRTERFNIESLISKLHLLRIKIQSFYFFHLKLSFKIRFTVQWILNYWETVRLFLKSLSRKNQYYRIPLTSSWDRASVRNGAIAGTVFHAWTRRAERPSPRPAPDEAFLKINTFSVSATVIRSRRMVWCGTILNAESVTFQKLYARERCLKKPVKSLSSSFNWSNLYYAW